MEPISKKMKVESLFDWDKEKWDEYKNQKDYSFDSKITPFIISKVPLSNMFDENSTNKSLTISKLYDELLDKKIVISYAIDVTCNQNFYHRIDEWVEYDIEYIKIPEFPFSDEKLKDFFEICNNAKKEEQLILIFDELGNEYSFALIMLYYITLLDFPYAAIHEKMKQYNRNGLKNRDIDEFFKSRNPLTAITIIPPTSFKLISELSTSIVPYNFRVTQEINDIDFSHYWVTYNAIGVKSFLLLKNNKAYFVNESFFFPCDVFFPEVNDTVFEGIIVSEKVNSGVSYRYLISDILYDNGIQLNKLLLNDRTNLIVNNYIKYRNKLTPEMKMKEKIKIKMIDFFSIRKFNILRNEIIPKLNFETKGILFVSTSRYNINDIIYIYHDNINKKDEIEKKIDELI